jgi:outer membrane protein
MSLHHRLAVTALLATAAGITQAQESPRQDLTAIPVARSFNLVGIGVGLIPRFSGANESRSMVLPVVRLAWRDKLYWNALQAGAWLWDSADGSLRVGLAVEPRFGWESEAGTRVEGMEKRDFSIEGGPNIQWGTPAGVFYASFYQDLGGASDASTAQVQFIRALVGRQALRLNGLIGLQWFSARSNDYYFGVRPGEARPGRPAYSPSASVSVQAGLNGAYALTARGSLLFGAVLNRIGEAAADSPIVETPWQGVVYTGLGWSF